MSLRLKLNQIKLLNEGRMERSVHRRSQNTELGSKYFSYQVARWSPPSLL